MSNSKVSGGQSGAKAAALLVLAFFQDVKVADDAAFNLRNEAAKAVHRDINIRKVTTTTAVAAALASGEMTIAKDMKFKTNPAVGYFATAGMVLTIGPDAEGNGATIPDTTAAVFMWDIQKIGQTRAKQIIRKAESTLSAYETIRAEAQVAIDAARAEAAAKKTDATLLKAAQGVIDAAVKLDATDEGAKVAHALIAALSARYGTEIVTSDVAGTTTDESPLSLVG